MIRIARRFSIAFMFAPRISERFYDWKIYCYVINYVVKVSVSFKRGNNGPRTRFRVSFLFVAANIGTMSRTSINKYRAYQ